jgi:hypothetical protein
MVYRRAEMFFVNGEYALAAQEYKHVADEFPQAYLADDALFKLAHVDRVHLGKPKDALAAYDRLVTSYADSPYADDAMLWSVSIWAKDLRQPAKAAEVCAQIDQRFADRAALRARAHLAVARAYLEAGLTDDAWREAEKVTTDFGDQEEPAAAAMLVMAQVWDAAAPGNANQSTAILEQVARDYPNTMAGEEARRKLGFKYYALHQQDQQKQIQAMAKEAQWLTRVPPVRRHSDGRLTMMEAARSLLGFAGAAIDLGTLAALSGQALVPEPGLDGKAAAWKDDPVSAVFEACGYAPTAWMARNRDEAWNAAKMVVIRRQPALVAYNGGTPWIIVTGWKPMQTVVGIMAPGDARPKAVKLTDFLARWEPASQAVQSVHFPGGAYYVAAIGGRRNARSAADLRRAALDSLQRAVVASAGETARAAREAARRLRDAAGNEAQRGPMSRWARSKLVPWAEDRRVAAEFLAGQDQAVEAAALHAAEAVAALRSAILSARPGPEGADDWQAAAVLADKLATEEEAFDTAVRDSGNAAGGA